jgi:hypothetical protein
MIINSKFQASGTHAASKYANAITAAGAQVDRQGRKLSVTYDVSVAVAVAQAIAKVEKWERTILNAEGV